ncbi:MAG: NAD(P)-dependent oxidoreductase [Bacillota bacterium]|nr:NAD(P)-dependent oxidoreductase [Bacillota bacterium]
MKIIVTGAGGFVGRPVMHKLNSIPEIEAVPLSRKTTDYSVKSLREVFRDAEAVIHLAGVKGGSGSITDFHVNEEITENILISMGEEKVGRIVFASSRLVYSDPLKIPWKEDSPLEPMTMYGISKVACESLCRLYATRYGFTYANVRIAQVLGPDEGARNMMNVFLDTSLQGGQLRVQGKSIAKRQYIYVEDLADILCSLAMDDSGESLTLNAGMPAAYTNLEIARLINQVFGNDTPIEYDDSFPETIQSSEMDVSNLIKKTGSAPRDMEQALKDLFFNISSR